MDASRGFPIRGGHEVTFYVDGKEMMAAVRDAIVAAKETIHLADWRLTPELELAPDTHPGETLADLLAACVARNVKVRAMIWESPKGPFQDNKDVLVARTLRPRGVEVIVVNRWLTTSHHQKLVLVDGAVGFVGGVDLAGGRWDDAAHPSFPPANDPRMGDYQSVFVANGRENPTAGTWNFRAGGPPRDARNRAAPRLPWHDVHARLRGPAVGDLEEVYRGRWNVFVARGLGRPAKIPPLPAPPAQLAGHDANVQVVASIDSDSIELTSGSVCRTYEQAYCDLIERAKRLIYIENQYFVSVLHGGTTDHRVIETLIARLKRAVQDATDPLEVVVVLPVHPDGDPATAPVRELYHWQEKTIDRLVREVGDGVARRIGFFSLANKSAEGPLAQIYVHAKAMVVDDEVAIVGSGNLNARSMAGSNDTEIGIVVSQAAQVRDLRRQLCSEHLGAPPADGSLLKQFRDAVARGGRLVDHRVPPTLIWGWESAEPLAHDTFGLPDSLFYVVPEIAGSADGGTDPLGLAPTDRPTADGSDGAPLGIVANKPPTAWERFKGLFGSEAEHLVVASIPPERTAGAGEYRPLRAGQGYFRVNLAEMFLAKNRSWFTDWAPVVHSNVSLRFGGERVEIPYVAGLALPGVGPDRLERAVLLDHPLTPLLPFDGGTVEISVALVALKSGDELQPILKLLGDVSGILRVPQVSAVLGVARPLAKGVQDFFASAHGGLQLGFHETFVGVDGGGPRLAPGFIAVVGASEDRVDPARLWVKDRRLRFGDTLETSEPLTGHDYVLLEIAASEQRDDWRDLKDIGEPLRMAVEALSEDDERAETYLRGALTSIVRSADLAKADRARVVALARAEFEENKRLLRGDG